MFQPLFTAIRTLTIIPLRGRGEEKFAASLLFFPLVGAGLGATAIGAQYVSGVLGHEAVPVVALLSLGIVSWLTGFIHIDGLGDVADAFGGARERESVLEILKDPHHGTFGVSAIFFDLALKAALWTVLMQQGKGGVVMASCILSRSMQALSVSFFPRARSTGTTACYPTSKGARAAAVAGLLISLAAVLALTDVVFTAVLGAAALFTWIILCSYFLRRISGITGDCIGAVNECCELGALAAGLMVVTFM